MLGAQELKSTFTVQTTKYQACWYMILLRVKEVIEGKNDNIITL